MRTGRIKPGYGIIQREIMSCNISVFSKAVYCLLVSYAGEKESCYPSLKTMCDDLRISKPTVIKSLKELIAAGFLVADKSRTKLGDYANNIYYPMYVMDTVSGVVSHVDNPSNSGLQPVVNGVDTKNNNIKEELLFNNNSIEKGKKQNFKPPLINEVTEYFRLLKDESKAIKFYDFYTSKGWMVGKNKMKDWQAAARNFKRSHDEEAKTKEAKQSSGTMSKLEL